VKPQDIGMVGVVGCGVMGSGIVEVAARAGADVVFIEGSADLVALGLRAIQGSVGKAVEKAKLDAPEAEKVLGRIRGTTDMAELADSDLVIEAATELVEEKLEIFRRLGQVTRHEIVLASNTSSIPIVELAVASGRPDKVVGMHFFNPPTVMMLLELTPSLLTSEQTMSFVRTYGTEILGKTCVTASDEAGFIVNRLLIPYVNDAIRMLEAGLATRDDIDTAIHLGLAHPMGPLRLCDLIGLDTTLNVGEVLFSEFGDSRYAPPPLLRRMVAAGRLGRKTGSGFYEY
jgi:3-hydroxybutyryl-CoA dehydrogenase